MTEKALIAVEKLDVAVVFSDGGMDKILKEVEVKTMSHVPDLTTDDGRKDIAAMAHKVARSKTLIDDLGKDLVSDWKQKAKRIDGYRKTKRDFLDDLKDRVRKPLNEWEAIEAKKKEEEDRKKKEKIDKRIADLAAFGRTLSFFEVASMEDVDFDLLLHTAMCAHDTEQKRLAEEEVARKAESERLEMDERQRKIKEKLVAFAEAIFKYKNDIIPDLPFKSAAYPLLAEAEIAIEEATKRLIKKAKEL